MDQTRYRRIVSGQDTRPGACRLRFVLRGLALLYGALVCGRNRLYDVGLLKRVAVGVPVICVGNLTAGGTGKTPLVIWLCRYLHGKGLRCAVLTRGYKTEPGTISDEPALLAAACPGVEVVVNANRAAGAQTAIARHQAQVLIMDDGFQHRRLRRDLDILAIDATCPFGYGRLLPAGLLREPIGAVRRAQAAVLTRTDQADADQLRAIEATLDRTRPGLAVARTVHRHTHAVDSRGRRVDLEALRAKRVVAFCGIGNPEAFFESLTRSGLTVIGTRTFDDHHAYTRGDLAALAQQGRDSGADMAVCTQKDWSKCATLVPDDGDVRFVSLAMELDFVAGFDTITHQLDTLLDTKGIPSR